MKLVRFTRNSGREIREHISAMVRGGARGMVFDLRDNGGGLLSEAVEVADVFLDEFPRRDGRLIVYSEGRPEVSPLRAFS